MKSWQAFLFFVLGIAFLLVGLFFQPIKRIIQSNVEIVDANQAPMTTEDESSSLPPPPLPPPPPPRKEIDNKVLDFAEVMPEYPGGVVALQKEVQKNYRIPFSYRNSGKKGGTLVTRFVVKEDGSIGSVQVLKGIDDCAACNEEAVRAVKALKHNFNPGKQAGKPVRVNFTLPIVIKIR